MAYLLCGPHPTYGAPPPASLPITLECHVDIPTVYKGPIVFRWVDAVGVGSVPALPGYLAGVGPGQFAIAHDAVGNSYEPYLVGLANSYVFDPVDWSSGPIGVGFSDTTELVHLQPLAGDMGYGWHSARSAWLIITGFAGGMALEWSLAGLAWFWQGTMYLVKQFLS